LSIEKNNSVDNSISALLAGTGDSKLVSFVVTPVDFVFQNHLSFIESTKSDDAIDWVVGK